MEEDGIEEVGNSSASARLLRKRSGGGDSSSRWVDGSEVDSESPPWSLIDDDEKRSEGHGSVRRRLVRKLKSVDSFDVEAMAISGSHSHHSKEVTIWQTLGLAFQTLGVVYGDMGTSPLYVFSDVFSKVHIQSDIDVLGALSLVIYTIALVPLAKYCFIVLKANDNGEELISLAGGTFALYSLICRYAKINLLPNHQQADEYISSFRLKLPTPELERALKIKEKLEHNSFYKTLLLLLVLTGTSMIIGDGALVSVSIVILVGLFAIQRFGTSKVGLTFAPCLALWFFSLGSIGLYNLIKYDISVVKAVNPAYIYFFFKKNSGKAWSALGMSFVVKLRFSFSEAMARKLYLFFGAEAMFADLGHFSVPSIQVHLRVVFEQTDGLFWPVFVIATAAAIIASQAMISASFSCIKQSMALGCFPRLKIIHTSRRFMGQIYIPVINWFLMIMCILVVATFRSTTDIANAYGPHDVGDDRYASDMANKHLFSTVFPGCVWIDRAHIPVSCSIQDHRGRLASARFRFLLPLRHVHLELRERAEVPKRSPRENLNGLHERARLVPRNRPSPRNRTTLQRTSPRNTIRSRPYVPVPVVSQDERFLFRRICPKDYHMFQCVARYGYKDVRKEDHRAFEQLLVESLEKFMRKEASELELETDVVDAELDRISVSPRRSYSGELSVPLIQHVEGGESAVLPPSMMGGTDEDPSLEYELSALREAMESGFTYLLGHGDVRAKKESFFLKKLVINYFYTFLRTNCRGGAATMRVPHMNIIQVGMTYMV
ncbi:potassium transporter, partial [Cynara cardunculus var. scolymus]